MLGSKCGYCSMSKKVLSKYMNITQEKLAKNITQPHFHMESDDEMGCQQWQLNNSYSKFLMELY
jgi:hypothetical protein